MKFLSLFIVALTLFSPLRVLAADTEVKQDAPGKDETVVVTNDGPQEKRAVIVESHTTEFIEHVVDNILVRFHVRTDENTPTRYAISVGILVFTVLIRTVIVMLLFSLLGQLAKRTNTTLDDKLFAALRSPVATLVVVVGAVGALKALKLSDSVDSTLVYVYTIAFSLVLFWLLFRAFNTVLDHLTQVVVNRQMGVAAFMPWIKKTLIVFFLIIGALTIAQSLGADVKAFMAGLGIGGLAFALAAQDTIANVFGSVVVAVDQPFKLGETIKIAGNVGTVEEIGLRSTRLRLVDKSLMVIPNKTVASEAIINLSKFTQRRFEQNFGISYDATPEQIEGLVEDIRAIVLAEKGVDPTSVVVQFTEFAASALNIWVIFVTKNNDFAEAIRIRQRIYLNTMRTMKERGLSFAFPTQSVHVESLPQLTFAPTENGNAKKTIEGRPADQSPSSG